MTSLIRGLLFKVANCSTTVPDDHHKGESGHKFVGTPGVPAMPADIGFNSGKDTGGVQNVGFTEGITRNPLVPIGIGLTCLALLGMFKSSLAGDKIGAQKYMRYRIYAQFGTVFVLCAGVVYAGTVMFKGNKEKKE